MLFQVPGPDVEPERVSRRRELPDCFSIVLDLGRSTSSAAATTGSPHTTTLREAYGLDRKTSFTAITGESTESFPDDPEIDAADPIDDPDILDFTRLVDAEATTSSGKRWAEEGAGRARGGRRWQRGSRLFTATSTSSTRSLASWRRSHLGAPSSASCSSDLEAQFEALRDGDRFFYGNDPSLQIIEKRYGVGYRHTLAQVIEDETRT